jgi:CubicO group peptidase (beta-lactamase class C family)
MRGTAFAACMAVLALAGCAVSPVDRELAAIANDPERPLASLSVLAIRDGKVVYERQFGRRYIDNADPTRDKGVDGSTLFRIASVSKLVTTIGALKLVEEGRLALDADIGDALGYPVRNPHFPETPVTLRMLLSHTSSLRDDAGYYRWGDASMKDFLTPGGSAFGNAAMWSREAPPGAYFSYANLPWGVVGTIMEKATGERFDRLMKRLVLDPMGMTGGYNTAEIPADRIANIATLYRKATAGDVQTWNPSGPWIPQVDDYSAKAPVPAAGPAYAIGSNGALFGPQGGLRASARDLGRLMLMLVNSGELDGRRILRKEMVDAMLSPQWTRGGARGDSAYGSHRQRFNAWGLGNQIFLDVSGPDFGDRLVEGGGFRAHGHLGDAYGLFATFAFDPVTKNGFVFLSGGTGFDPELERGEYSAASRFEERIATTLYKRAILRATD